MALPSAQFEPKNDQLAIPPDGGVPPSADNGLLGQHLAPVYGSSGLANGRSDMEGKDGNVPSNVQGLSPASPEQEPALGLSDLNARNGSNPVGATPPRTAPSVMNGVSGQGSAPINSSAGLTNGDSDVEAKYGKIASNVQDRSAASSNLSPQQGLALGYPDMKATNGGNAVGAPPPGTSPPVSNSPLEQASAPVDPSSRLNNGYLNKEAKDRNIPPKVHRSSAASSDSSPEHGSANGNSILKDKTGAISVGATPPGTSPSVMNGHLEQGSAPINSLSGANAQPKMDSKSGDTPATNQVISPVSSPSIATASSESSERSLDANKNLKPSGNTPTTIQAASPKSAPPIANASSETSERASDGQPELEAEGQDFPGNVEPAPLGSSPPLANTSSEQSSTPLGASSDGNSTSKAEEGDSSPTNTAAQGTPPAVANGTPDQVSAPGSLRDANGPLDQSKQQEGTSTRPGRRNGGQKRGRAAENEETERFTGDILSVEDFHNSLIGLHPGSDPFMKIFKDHEMSHLENPTTFVIHLLENGERFREAVGDFKNVYLINVKDKLGMEAPEDLSFDTILVYIPPGTELGINYSNSTAQDPLDTTVIEEYLKHFNIPVKHRDFIRNSITLEFSKLPLGEKFTEPSFARENSMVHELEDALEKEKEKTKEELKKIQEELKKKPGNRLELKKTLYTIEKKMKKLDGMIGSMPRYTKYLIISQEGSFTDVHFDFSGTSVYYHVFKGQKIFYIAPPTPENMRIYMDHKEKGGTEWVGTTLKNQWRRVVINEGQTAWIPGGYLHCVYTPVDSLVIGGNFLMKKYAKLQFECTEHEEKLLPKRDRKKNINTSHLFEEFRPVMWGYTEYCLLPRLREAKDEESVELGEVFVKHCNPEARCLEKKKENKWYTKPEKRALHLELKQVMGMADADQPSTSAASNPTIRGPTKKKPEIMDEAEEVKAPGASQASSSVGANSRSRKRGPGKKTMKKDEEEETVGESEAKGARMQKEKPTNVNGKEEEEIPETSEEPSTLAAWDCKRSQKRPGMKQMVESEGEDMEADLSDSEGIVDPDQPSTSNPEKREPRKKKPKIMDKEETVEIPGEPMEASTSASSGSKSKRRGPGKKELTKDEEENVGASEGIVDPDQPSTSNPEKREPGKKKPEIMDEGETVEILGTSMENSTSASSGSKSKKRGPGRKTMKKGEEDVVGESESSQDAARGESSSASLPSTASSSILKRKSAAPRRSAKPSTSAVAKQTKKRKEREESMNQEEEGTSSQEPSSSSLSAPAPISRRKAAPKRPKRENAMFAAVPEHDDPIDQLFPDPQANVEGRKSRGAKESQPRSGKALGPEKKKPESVEEPMEVVEEDEEEVLGEEDAAQVESSSTNLPSTSAASRSVKRKSAASRRFANPSAPAVSKQTRKIKEKEESMDQEGEEASSQEPGTSSRPASASISRRRKNPPHPRTSEAAPKRQKQGNAAAISEQPDDDSVDQSSPDPQADVEGKKIRSARGSQPCSGKALGSEKKKSGGAVEEPMEIVEENEEEVLGNGEDMLREVSESNQPCCSSTIPYHTGDDDYDGGSRGGETMDSGSVEQSMDVDGEEKDEVLGGKKEETSKNESTQLASSSITPCNNTTSASNCLTTSQNDESEVLVVPATETADKEDQQTSVVSDSKNKESIPDEEPSGVDGAGKNEVLEGEKKSTPKENDTSPADSACISSNNGDSVFRSADPYQIPQEDVVDQRSSPDSNSKGKNLESAPQMIEKVQNVQEEMMERQDATRTEAPPSEGTPPATSLKRTHTQVKKEGEVPAKRARADQLKQRRLTPPRTHSPHRETTAFNYLYDLVSFLGKLKHQNPKLKEFIKIMGGLVRSSNKLEQEMLYSEILFSMKRLFNSFKNNFVTLEINTEDVKVLKDEVNFELKAFLCSFKNFVSTFETTHKGFGQLLTDIGDEIRKCEEVEEGGKQKMMLIADIIVRVSPDFDQYGLVNEYNAEVVRRRASEGAGGSNAR